MKVRTTPYTSRPIAQKGLFSARLNLMFGRPSQEHSLTGRPGLCSAQ